MIRCSTVSTIQACGAVVRMSGMSAFLRCTIHSSRVIALDGIGATESEPREHILRIHALRGPYGDHLRIIACPQILMRWG